MTWALAVSGVMGQEEEQTRGRQAGEVVSEGETTVKGATGRNTSAEKETQGSMWQRGEEIVMRTDTGYRPKRLLPNCVGRRRAERMKD